MKKLIEIIEKYLIRLGCDCSDFNEKVYKKVVNDSFICIKRNKKTIFKISKCNICTKIKLFKYEDDFDDYSREIYKVIKKIRNNYTDKDLKSIYKELKLYENGVVKVFIKNS